MEKGGKWGRARENEIGKETEEPQAIRESEIKAV